MSRDIINSAYPIMCNIIIVDLSNWFSTYTYMYKHNKRAIRIADVEGLEFFSIYIGRDFIRIAKPYNIIFNKADIDPDVATGVSISLPNLSTRKQLVAVGNIEFKMKFSTHEEANTVDKYNTRWLRIDSISMSNGPIIHKLLTHGVVAYKNKVYCLNRYILTRSIIVDSIEEGNEYIRYIYKGCSIIINTKEPEIDYNRLIDILDL